MRPGHFYRWNPAWFALCTAAAADGPAAKSKATSAPTPQVQAAAPPPAPAWVPELGFRTPIIARPPLSKTKSGMTICPAAVWPPVVVPPEQSQHVTGDCGIVVRICLPRSLMPLRWDVEPEAEFQSCLQSAAKTLQAMSKLHTPPSTTSVGSADGSTASGKPRLVRKLSSGELPAGSGSGSGSGSGVTNPLPSPPLLQLPVPTSPTNLPHSAVTPVARIPSSPMPGEGDVPAFACRDSSLCSGC